MRSMLRIQGLNVPVRYLFNSDAPVSITTTLLAAYIFAAPAPAKYLSQFISARISCANHIPTELLGM
jgi:hypothetical protein